MLASNGIEPKVPKCTMTIAEIRQMIDAYEANGYDFKYLSNRDEYGNLGGDEITIQFTPRQEITIPLTI